MATENQNPAGSARKAIAGLNLILPPEIRARLAPTSTRKTGGEKQFRLSFTARVSPAGSSRSIAPMTINDIPEAISEIGDWLNGELKSPVNWDANNIGLKLVDFLEKWDGEPIKFRCDYPQHLKDSPTRLLSRMLPDFFNVTISMIGRGSRHAKIPKVVVLVRLPKKYTEEALAIPGALPKANFSFVANTPSEALTKTLEMLEHLAMLRIPFRPNWTPEQRKSLEMLAAGSVTLDMPWHYGDSCTEGRDAR